jgi:hypothetical protein
MLREFYQQGRINDARTSATRAESKSDNLKYVVR